MRGVLYRGDPKTKYSEDNVPAFQDWRSTWPEQLAVVMQLPNRSEACNFMVKTVDFDEQARTPMPDVKSAQEL